MNTGGGRREVPRPGAPAGSGPCPRESIGDQTNTQKRRGSHVTKNMSGPERNSLVSQVFLN